MPVKKSEKPKVKGQNPAYRQAGYKGLCVGLCAGKPYSVLILSLLVKKKPKVKSERLKLIGKYIFQHF